MISKIKKILNQIKLMADEISSITGRNKCYIFCDIVWCIIRYSASPNNYKLFEFYSLSAAERGTYVTHGISEKMIKKFNKDNYRNIFENKITFADQFKEFFKRDWIESNCEYEVFLKFAQGKEKVIYKPIEAAQGQGICVFHVEKDSVKEIHEKIKSLPLGIVEDWIEQHSVLEKIYPDAVNCLRIITVLKGNDVHMLTGGVTFAIKDEIANGSLESIIAPIDMQSGVINKPAATFGSDIYEKHPKTNSQIHGIQLPYWQEIKAMLQKAGKVIPQVGYIGWDIAITPNGPILIEGNTSPGYKYYQIPVHCKNKQGNKNIYIKYL